MYIIVVLWAWVLCNKHIPKVWGHNVWAYISGTSWLPMVQLLWHYTNYYCTDLVAECIQEYIIEEFLIHQIHKYSNIERLNTQTRIKFYTFSVTIWKHVFHMWLDLQKGAFSPRFTCTQTKHHNIWFFTAIKLYCATKYSQIQCSFNHEKFQIVTCNE